MNVTLINEHIREIVKDRSREEEDRQDKKNSQIKTDPAAIQRFLDVCGYVFRDALVYKTGAGKNHLILSDESADIADISRKLSYASLSQMYKETLQAVNRIRANVNAELVLESLFISIRERIAQE
jgi:DNA polymerase III gamma/tau subunit